MGMQFGLPTSLNGKQFQFMLKLSNGTILNSNLITLGSSHTGSASLARTSLSMGYANVFSIPAGITTCLVGFKIVGGVSADTAFAFGGGLLFKTRNADGEYTSVYNKTLQIPRGATHHNSSKALVQTGASALSPSLWYDSDEYANAMAKIDLYTESFDFVGSVFKSFSTSISPNGMRWGENTEYRPQHGVAIKTTTASIAVANNGSAELPTTSGSPSSFNIVTTWGQSITTDWNTAGATWSASGSVGLFARRAGMYMVTAWASAGNSTDGQFLEIWNATTGERWGIGGKMPPNNGNVQDLSASAIVPCSNGDRISVRYFNFTGASRTVTSYRIAMAQLI
jgi:hypothetical protein